MNKLLLEEYLIINHLLSDKIDELKNKSILVTGATGLIASYLVDYLLYLNATRNINIRIYVVSRKKEKIIARFGNDAKIIAIEQDLNDSFTQDIVVDYIIHAASQSHPLAFSRDPVGTMKTNLLGTINLLEMTKATKAKFVYFSTGEIYGNNLDKAFTEEDLGFVDSKLVRSCYPESKRAGETLCMAYHQQYGVPVVVLRFCYVYGPTITDENSRADAQFLRNAMDKQNIVLKSPGLQKRTYCYVADAVSATLFSLLRDDDVKVYNIANPNSVVSIREYAQVLARLSGVDVRFEFPDEIEKQGYSKQADSILDATKLINLGWFPQFDIKTGLKHTLEIKGCNK